MVTKAVVQLSDSDKRMQTVQVSEHAGEVGDDLEHYEAYGFTSRPLDPETDGRGAEALVVDVGDTTDHQVAILVGDRRYRLTALAQGEVAIYDDQGQRVHLTRSGIVIKSGLIELGDGGLAPTDGLVHGSGIDPLTGATYFSLGNASSVVRGKA